MLDNSLKKFIHTESFAGMLLVSAAAIALVLANSPMSSWYTQFIDTKFFLGINSHELRKPLLLWINDGLMALFFLLIGLELKREFLEGQLRNLNQIILPGMGAIGGIAVPVLIYVYFNYSSPETIDGWAIPAATDIAFALGVLALFSTKVSPGLKIFLLTLAIFDDVAAILIIAVFYAHDISTISILLATIVLLVLVICNLLNVRSVSTFAIFGIMLWACVLQSGVHATIAGVLLAFTIPHRCKEDDYSPLNKMEDRLHAWVAWFILPLFAFINSGIDFSQFNTKDLFSPLSLGIFFGLFLGKQLGVFAFSAVAIKLKWAKLPEDTTWLKLYGVCVLTGIGFTMSFFISSLAFAVTGQDYSSMSRLSIIAASLASALIGAAILACTKPIKPQS